MYADVRCLGKGQELIPLAPKTTRQLDVPTRRSFIETDLFLLTASSIGYLINQQVSNSHKMYGAGVYSTWTRISIDATPLDSG